MKLARRATKTTVYLEADDYRVLQSLARAQRRPAAELIRESVALFVRRHAARRRPASIGAGHSGRGSVSERAETLLRGFGRDR